MYYKNNATMGPWSGEEFIAQWEKEDAEAIQRLRDQDDEDRNATDLNEERA